MTQPEKPKRQFSGQAAPGSIWDTADPETRAKIKEAQKRYRLDCMAYDAWYFNGCLPSLLTSDTA